MHYGSDFPFYSCHVVVNVLAQSERLKDFLFNIVGVYWKQSSVEGCWVYWSRLCSLLCDWHENETCTNNVSRYIFIHSADKSSGQSGESSDRQPNWFCSGVNWTDDAGWRPTQWSSFVVRHKLLLRYSNKAFWLTGGAAFLFLHPPQCVQPSKVSTSSQSMHLVCINHWLIGLQAQSRRPLFRTAKRVCRQWT